MFICFLPTLRALLFEFQSRIYFMFVKGICQLALLLLGSVQFLPELTGVFLQFPNLLVERGNLCDSDVLYGLKRCYNIVFGLPEQGHSIVEQFQ